MFKQALDTTRAVTDDTDTHLKVLRATAEEAIKASIGQTPAALSQPVYDIVRKITGVDDPYAEAKKESNRITLGLLPDLKKKIVSSPHPLNMALRAAAAGNVIDLGLGYKYDIDIEKDMDELMSKPFAIDATDELEAESRPGAKVLYLGDNAGEITFDTLLVEQLLNLKLDVTFVVKSGAIINDATMEDAEKVGMTSLVNVITTGSRDIGVNWSNASDDFKRYFREADIIIAKGHGNFETCNDAEGNLYFLLKAKCQMVAKELGVKLGDTVFKHVGKWK